MSEGPMKGRRKPASLKALEGNPGRRPIKEEVHPVGDCLPPAHLTDVELAKWNELMAAFPESYFSAADVHVVTRFCFIWAKWEEVKMGLDEVGLLTKVRGRIQRSPHLVVLRQLADELDVLTRELGLSPLSRGKIGVDDGKRGGESLTEQMMRAGL